MLLSGRVLCLACNELATLIPSSIQTNKHKGKKQETHSSRFWVPRIVMDAMESVYCKYVSGSTEVDACVLVSIIWVSMLCLATLIKICWQSCAALEDVSVDTLAHRCCPLCLHSFGQIQVFYYFTCRNEFVLWFVMDSYMVYYILNLHFVGNDRCSY